VRALASTAGRKVNHVTVASSGADAARATRTIRVRAGAVGAAGGVTG
jgi:hypothetical protein